jgi:hypothetical protein
MLCFGRSTGLVSTVDVLSVRGGMGQGVIWMNL